VSAFDFGFFAHQFTGFLQEFRVPCCSQCGAIREAGCGGAIEESSAADTIGAVGETEGRDVEAGDSFCVPEIDAFEIDQ